MERESPTRFESEASSLDRLDRRLGDQYKKFEIYNAGVGAGPHCRSGLSGSHEIKCAVCRKTRI